MSVATQLGLADPDNDLLALARAGWAGWGVLHPCLGVTGDLLGLPAWLATADGGRADEVLLALAQLASPTGGDDVAATGALVWVLLPGASLVAHRLRTLTHRIDEVVAAQLWVEVRTFPWERGRKVAANVLMNTRRGVLRDLGVGEHLRRADPTWFHAVPLSPTAMVWGRVERARFTGEPSPAHELADLLRWAMRAQVITASECRMLLALAEEADRTGQSRARRGQLGLMAPAASEAVAGRWGVSARTVRRRAQRSLGALGHACTEGRILA